MSELHLKRIDQFLDSCARWSYSAVPILVLMIVNIGHYKCEVGFSNDTLSFLGVELNAKAALYGALAYWVILNLHIGRAFYNIAAYIDADRDRSVDMISCIKTHPWILNPFQTNPNSSRGNVTRWIALILLNLLLWGGSWAAMFMMARFYEGNPSRDWIMYILMIMVAGSVGHFVGALEDLRTTIHGKTYSFWQKIFIGGVSYPLFLVSYFAIVVPATGCSP